MKAVKNIGRGLDEGRRLEKEGNPEQAAAAYQGVVDQDPVHVEAVGRLLILYRRLKDYKKELAVIEAALAAHAQRDKVLQAKWLSQHPQAAKAGKDILRSLGGAKLSAFGADPEVPRLQKRKEVVERRLGIKPAKAKKKAGTGTRAAADRKAGRLAGAEARKEVKRAEVEARKAERVAEAEARKEVKRAEVEARKAAKQADAEARESAKRAAAEKKAQPSLFVITLRYLVALEKIDEAMTRHVAFLDKHFAQGEFLIAGRQVPRTGGVIIARGRNREAVERMMKQDPFVKGRLASVDIVEFRASKMGKGFAVS
jgi:uncharacterized protein YciI